MRKKQKESSTDTVKKRMDKIALCSRGVFYVGFVAKSSSERDSFKNLLRQNPEFFESFSYTDKKLAPKIYKLKTAYYSKRPELSLTDKKKILGDLLVLRAFTWGGFISEYNINIAVPDKVFKVNGKRCFLDSFKDDSVKGCEMVVTLPFRENLWEEKGIIALVPGGFRTKRLNELVNDIVYSANAKTNDPSTWKEGDSRFLEGGIWPKTKGQIHKNKRKYFNRNQTGDEKVALDKRYLKEMDGKSLNEQMEILNNYRIGIERIKGEN